MKMTKKNQSNVRQVVNASPSIYCPTFLYDWKCRSAITCPIDKNKSDDGNRSDEYAEWVNASQLSNSTISLAVLVVLGAHHGLSLLMVAF